MMASPDYFDIVDVKNPYMKDQEGKVNKTLASKQWDFLRNTYRSLVAKNILDEVLEIKGAVNCEDMVFAANQTFPWITDKGEKVVIMSKMKHASRQREVSYFEEYFKNLGYKIIHLKHTQFFEGMGDTIPHPGRRLLYGGFGHRSEIESYTEISELFGVSVITLELKDEKFYHLDTCFLPADEKNVLLYKKAFTHEGLDMIKTLFENVIEVPANEAENFALNAHVVYNTQHKIALIQKNNSHTTAILRKLGFEVIEADTSEFMKSGGSIFCMKMMVY
ncbi:MAG: hypothetical protein K2X86_02820 [Cytophagaceae bacterium]|nr:hypothetical protein [Cytophagaceae bacterium]